MSRLKGPMPHLSNFLYADRPHVPKIFVFAHGLKNYDSHFLLSECYCFCHGTATEVYMLPKTEEKMLSFSMWPFQFKDTYSFLAESLSALTDSLVQKGRDKFEKIMKYMPKDVDIDLFFRKGVFPYSYLDNYTKLEERDIPPRECFFSDLTEQHVSMKDYKFAKRVWRELSCGNLRDYMEAYLITDVLLLADVFENFGSNCLLDYGLDPAHYLSSAHFTMDAFLRNTSPQVTSHTQCP